MQKIKNNLFLIVVMVILTILLIMSVKEYLDTHEFVVDNYYKGYKMCENMPRDDEHYYNEVCGNILEREAPKKLDAYTMTIYLINVSTAFSSIQIFVPLLIMAVGIRKMYKEIKSGTFRNMVLIQGYKKYMVGIIKKTWKYALILPAVILIAFIISCIASGNFDYITTMNNNRGGYIESEYYNKLFFFLFTYVIVLTLHAIVWLNLAIICTKKSRNYVVTVVSGYLLYVGYSIVFEISSGMTSSELYSYMKTGQIWGYDEVGSFSLMILYSVILVTISTTLVYFQYRKKEGVIIANEV